MIFEFTNEFSDDGKPLPFLSERKKSQILKDPKLYVLNQVLYSWGYATVRLSNGGWVGGGKCPFTLRDSTKKRFQAFKLMYPQYKEFISSKETNSVAERKQVLKVCQQK